MGMNFSPMYQPVSTKTIKADGDLNINPYDLLATDVKCDTVEATEFVGGVGNFTTTVINNATINAGVGVITWDEISLSGRNQRTYSGTITPILIPRDGYSINNVDNIPITISCRTDTTSNVKYDIVIDNVIMETIKVPNLLATFTYIVESLPSHTIEFNWVSGGSTSNDVYFDIKAGNVTLY